MRAAGRGCRCLEFCNVTVVDQREAADIRRTLWYAFIGGPGEPRFALQRSASDPALLTTDLGLDVLASRSLTLVLFCALLASCVGFAVVMLDEGRRTRRAFAALSGQRLTPVIVEIERKNFLPPRQRMWVYLYNDAGGQQRVVVEWPSKDRPLFTSQDERWAVALQGTEGTPPLLLDANLACLDLTEAEKAGFYAACRSAFAGVG